MAKDVSENYQESDVVKWVGFNDEDFEWMSEVKSLNRNVLVFWDIFS